MKKLFLKLNMAIVFVIVLFASVSWGAVTQNNLAKYLNDKITFFDANGEPNKYYGTMISSVGTIISKDTLEEMEKDNVQIVYYYDGDVVSYLGARIGNDGPIMQISALGNDSTTYHFASTRSNMYVATEKLTNTVSVNKEIDSVVVLHASDLSEGKGYSFILDADQVNTDEIDINYINEDGKNTVLKPKENKTYNPGIVHQWGDTRKIHFE